MPTDRPTFNAVAIATKTGFNPDEVEQIATHFNIDRSLDEAALLRQFIDFKALMKQSGWKKASEALNALQSPTPGVKQNPADQGVSHSQTPAGTETPDPIAASFGAGNTAEHRASIEQSLALMQRNSRQASMMQGFVRGVNRLDDSLAAEALFLELASGRREPQTDAERVLKAQADERIQAHEEAMQSAFLQVGEGGVISTGSYAYQAEVTIEDALVAFLDRHNLSLPSVQPTELPALKSAAQP